MPQPAVVVPTQTCVLAGELLVGLTGGISGHLGDIGEASHGHQSFVDTTIACSDIGVADFNGDGGIDGHCADPTGDGDGWFGCGHVTASSSGGNHHGATSESGWSHSSGYSDGGGGGTSNQCDSTANDNKNDVTILSSTGWMKFVRSGAAMDVWGCMDGAADAAIADNPYFSGRLTIAPPAPAGVGNMPFCLLPGGPTCGYTVAGTLFRGPAWSVDLTTCESDPSTTTTTTTTTTTSTTTTTTTPVERRKHLSLLFWGTYSETATEQLYSFGLGLSYKSDDTSLLVAGTVNQDSEWRFAMQGSLLLHRSWRSTEPTEFRINNFDASFGIEGRFERARMVDLAGRAYVSAEMELWGRRFCARGGLEYTTDASGGDRGSWRAFLELDLVKW